MALIKCGECGQTISDKADKCPSCGSPVLQEIPEMGKELVKCSACGTVVANSAETCPKCGKNMNTAGPLDYIWRVVLLIMGLAFVKYILDPILRALGFL